MPRKTVVADREPGEGRRGPRVVPRLSMLTLTTLLRSTDPRFNHSTLALTLGVGRCEIMRFLRTGLPERRADEFACRLGFHPCEVWGADWWAIAALEPTGQVDQSHEVESVSTVALVAGLVGAA